jgi:hypothetical protein
LRTYREDFDDGPGGWIGWTSNARGPRRLEIRDSCAIERSPWWIDYNHAPPGGGYLHLPFSLLTRPHRISPNGDAHVSGPNRFIDGKFPTDFTNAKVTLRLRGDLDLHGANFCFHAQAKVGSVYVNYCLHAQPFRVTEDWSEQSVRLEPDPRQWTALSSRSDRADFYGDGDLRDVLRDLNNNIILVLYPLRIVPSLKVNRPHELRAGEDYEVDRSVLPQGCILLDEVRIDFPNGHPA